MFKLFHKKDKQQAKKDAAKRKMQKKYKTAFSNENHIHRDQPSVRDMLPWIAIDPDDKNHPEELNLVHGEDYSLFAVFKFRGPDMDSATKIEMMHYNWQLNNIFKTLPTGFVMYFDAQRHYETDYKHSDMPLPILQQMEDEREDYYGSKVHFDTDYYFILYHVPQETLKRRFWNFFSSQDKTSKKYKADAKLYFEFEDKFRDRAAQIRNQLALVFGQKMIPLTEEETLTYLHNIVSDRRMDAVNVNPLLYVRDYIADAGLICGREPKLGSKYMKIITLMNFPPVTSPGIFDVFNALNIEYRFVSRFICLSKTDAHKELSNYVKLWGQQVKGLWTIIRESITKTKMEDAIDESALGNKEDAAAALRELTDDFVSYGYYTMTLIVTDKNKQTCTDKANLIMETINSMGFTGYIETENSIDAWRGSLPGCYKCNVRRPVINSQNFCHLAPATSIWSGDKSNKHLKGPVLLYTDSAGYTPFRLSLHDGDVGHTLIVGPSGSGKSVLLNTLEAHFMKYKDSNVFIFDKAASSRALTYAVGGHFYNLAAEGMKDLSFQPLAHINDEKEIKWAKEWIIAYLSQKNLTITPEIEIYVWNALKSLSVMPPNQRTITVFNQLVQSQEIRQALQPLTMRGSYGKLFDNDTEFAGSGRWQVFEMETLMETAAIVPPTLDYLFHRIEMKINKATGPSLIVLDECWLFMDNEIFQNKLKEYMKDMRKKNTSIWIATQQLSDIANKPNLMDTVNDQCKNKVFLPNTNAASEANSSLYQIFGCNEQQISIISHMKPKQDYYYSNPDKGNRLFRLALQPAEIPFVTATAKTDQIYMNKLIADNKMNDFIHEWFMYKDAEPEWRRYKEYMKDTVKAVI